MFSPQELSFSTRMSNLEVIGAGLCRTGTLSLKTAFGILGYNSYHMTELMEHPDREDFKMWMALIRGERPDIDSIMKSYTATTDFPACWHYKELLRLSPKAKVRGIILWPFWGGN